MICPLIGKCSEKVSYEKYANVCSNITKDAFKECETWKRVCGGSMTPAEWTKLFTALTLP